MFCKWLQCTLIKSCDCGTAQLNISKLEARVVYVTVLPDKMELRFDASKYLTGPFLVLRRQIGFALSMIGAMWRNIMQSGLNEQAR